VIDKTSGTDEDGFEWLDVTVRGKTYHLREITGEDYEKILKMSVLPGSDGEKVDLNIQYKLMLAKSCTEPRLTQEVIGAMPFKKRRALLSGVIVLHFGDEAEDGFSNIRVPDGALQDVLKVITEWKEANPEAAGSDEDEGKGSSLEAAESSET
jgi:hypothetical protein